MALDPFRTAPNTPVKVEVPFLGARESSRGRGRPNQPNGFDRLSTRAKMSGSPLFLLILALNLGAQDLSKAKTDYQQWRKIKLL